MRAGSHERYRAQYIGRPDLFGRDAAQVDTRTRMAVHERRLHVHPSSTATTRSMPSLARQDAHGSRMKAISKKSRKTRAENSTFTKPGTDDAAGSRARGAQSQIASEPAEDRVNTVAPIK